jgi:hypothetical protein
MQIYSFVIWHTIAAHDVVDIKKYLCLSAFICGLIYIFERTLLCRPCSRLKPLLQHPSCNLLFDKPLIMPGLFTLLLMA